MKDLKIRARRGFTLIELVVVIAILGILAGLAIPRFLDATATARGARIVADMRTIDSAIVIYNAKTGSLPASKDAMLSDDSTKSPQYYQLLAAWPTPPTGTAKITDNAGKQVTIAETASAYTLGASDATDNTKGRALFGGKTVDDILAE